MPHLLLSVQPPPQHYQPKAPLLGKIILKLHSILFDLELFMSNYPHFISIFSEPYANYIKIEYSTLSQMYI